MNTGLVAETLVDHVREMIETSVTEAGLAPAVTIDGRGPARLGLGLKDETEVAPAYVTAASAADLLREPPVKTEKPIATVSEIEIENGAETETRIETRTKTKIGSAIARVAPAPREPPTSATPKPGSKGRLRSASRKPRPI